MGNLCGRKAHQFDEHDEENPRYGEYNEYDDDDTNKLDPKDFMFMKRTDDFIIKEAGSINGQQFMIDECNNCDIMLFDYCDSVTIDSCTDCRIYVGPCSSSVFIRDCHGCKIVVASQQLRLRDCDNLDLLLFVSAGQPSIESSTDIRIGCFQYSYFNLKQQFDAAGMSVFDNQWSNVHDFTAIAGETHWSFLPPSTHGNNLLKSLSTLDPTKYQSGEDEQRQQNHSVVPLTHGMRPLTTTSSSLLFVCTSSELSLSSLLESKINIIKTHEGKLNVDQLRRLFGEQSSQPVKIMKSSVVIGLEVDTSYDTLQQYFDMESMTSGEVYISPTTEIASKMSTIFFDELRPTI